MRNYDQAGDLEKKVIQLLIHTIFNQARASFNEHYRIEFRENGVYLRESTQNPPSQEARNAFMLFLRQISKYFKFARGHSSLMLIQYNSEKVNRIIRELVAKKPHGVSEQHWSLIPNRVKEKWKYFSDEMRDFIIKCMSINLQEKYDKLLTTAVLSDTMRCPINFTHPIIPVRLPNQHLTTGKTNQLFDLEAVLNIQQRDPQDIRRRANPITRDYFDLNEIIPDLDALQKLENNVQLQLSEIPAPNLNAEDAQSSQKPEISPTDAVQIFYNAHGKAFKKERESCCSFFRTTKIEKDMSLNEIICHALNDNRSNRVIKALHWLKEDGTAAHPDAPECVKQEINTALTSKNQVQSFGSFVRAHWRSCFLL